VLFKTDDSHVFLYLGFWQLTTVVLHTIIENWIKCNINSNKCHGYDNECMSMFKCASN